MVAADKEEWCVSSVEGVGQAVEITHGLSAVGGFGEAVTVENHHIVRDVPAQLTHSVDSGSVAMQIVKHQDGEVTGVCGGYVKTVKWGHNGVAEQFAVAPIVENLVSPHTIIVPLAGFEAFEPNLMLYVVTYSLSGHTGFGTTEIECVETVLDAAV